MSPLGGLGGGDAADAELRAQSEDRRVQEIIEHPLPVASDRLEVVEQAIAQPVLQGGAARRRKIRLHTKPSTPTPPTAMNSS